MGFAPSTMQLTSSAFAPMARIPTQKKGEGSENSPPLGRGRRAPQLHRRRCEAHESSS